MLLIVEFSIKFPAIYVNINKIYRTYKNTPEKLSLKPNLIRIKKLSSMCKISNSTGSMN